MIRDITRAWKLTLAWILSLVAVAALASALTSAQAPPPQALGIPVPEITEGTVILSGNDIGFRVERTRDGMPIGTLVVRIDGRWVEAGSSVRVTLAR